MRDSHSIPSASVKDLELAGESHTMSHTKIFSTNTLVVAELPDARFGVTEHAAYRVLRPKPGEPVRILPATSFSHPQIMAGSSSQGNPRAPEKKEVFGSTTAFSYPLTLEKSQNNFTNSNDGDADRSCSSTWAESLAVSAAPRLSPPASRAAWASRTFCPDRHGSANPLRYASCGCTSGSSRS
jgi:hypothetical protein